MDTQHQRDLSLLSSLPGFSALDAHEQQFIRRAALELRLSQQHIRKLCEAAVDLQLWEEPPVSTLWDESGTDTMTGKTRSRHILSRLFAAVDALRNQITTYEDFTPPVLETKRPICIEATHPSEKILGTCPVAGEKTRCCNLQTLDAVKQCGFACSYCSIQSFYDHDRVYFHEDLAQKLSALEIDDEQIYHIGTGQSSDSLMWGDQNGLLTDIFTFARRHPNVILELKTKSARTDWLKIRPLPHTVVATWSLNPQTIIDNEEHLTASLQARLHAARTAADAGVPIGFHIHPMVWYDRWQEDYGALFSRIQQEFTPDELVMISLGTLTFIRPVIKQLRDMGRPTRITQIPMNDAAGKLSYPLETKQELFSFAYRQFSQQWRDQVFFYLCMEDPSLWDSVFGYAYEDNEAFETGMKGSYMRKIDLIRQRHERQ